MRLDKAALSLGTMEWERAICRCEGSCINCRWASVQSRGHMRFGDADDTALTDWFFFRRYGLVRFRKGIRHVESMINEYTHGEEAGTSLPVTLHGMTRSTKLSAHWSLSFPAIVL